MSNLTICFSLKAFLNLEVLSLLKSPVIKTPQFEKRNSIVDIES